MTTADLQKHLDFFNEIYSEFLLHEHDCDKGSNKKIRDQGLRKAENVIKRFERYVDSNGLYNLLIGEGGSGFDRAVRWNEFTSLQWFSRDLAEAIEKIEHLITE